MQVDQRRGGLLEATHPVSAAAVRIVDLGAGPVAEPVLTLGAPCPTFWRSAAKPFQVLAILRALAESGHSENTPYALASLSDEDLAIGASSHSGGAEHLHRVRDLLDRCRLSPEQLRCGAEAPLDPTELRRIQRAGEAAHALHNDCSGKHALMLMACAARGWSTDTYLQADHPLQQRIAEVVAEHTGTVPPHATDGCGVPTFHLTLPQMARAWAFLALAMADPDADPLLSRIGHAMAEHPALTSGQRRIDLAVARRATGPFVGKIGALGVFCVAWPKARTGLAIKVHSADEDALAVAIPELVERACPGALAPPADDWPWSTVRNVVGLPVGERTFVPSPNPGADTRMAP